MKDLLLLLAFLVAIAIGWFLGRRELTSRQTDQEPRIPEDYLRGLHFMLSEQPEEAIDAFGKALEINDSTVEIHLALGRLFRIRGEVEKATQVHQNLLVRADLAKETSELVRYELAHNYMAAGLLDRAERLLRELSLASGETQKRSLHLLLEIYQREKEWQLAIEVALDLLPFGEKKIRPRLAHYCCELALRHIDKGELHQARRELKHALRHDGLCVRASLILGQLETQTGHLKEAIKALQMVKEQDPDYLPESIPELSACYQKIGKEKELEKFLLRCLDDNPSSTLLFAITDLLYAEPGREEDARNFVAAELMKRPSLKGLQRLIELQANVAPQSEQQQLQYLKKLTSQILDSKPVYQCSNCGYAGKQLTWQCPSCSEWGKIKPIYGLEGE